MRTRRGPCRGRGSQSDLTFGQLFKLHVLTRCELQSKYGGMIARDSTAGWLSRFRAYSNHIGRRRSGSHTWYRFEVLCLATICCVICYLRGTLPGEPK